MGAYSLNNWNENRKNEEEEKFFLEKLKRNIEVDASELLEHKTISMSLDSVLQVAAHEIQNADIDSFSSSLSALILHRPGFTPEKTVWENLKSSGKLALIENDQLVDSLFLYYQRLEELAVDISGAVTYTRETFGPYVIDNIPIDIYTMNLHEKLRLKPGDFIDDLTVKNILIIKKIIYINLIEEYESLIKLTDSLLEMIQRELMDN